ncbi:MAG: aspartate carbamoyltransferase, partial [Christensenellaceae bacterium]|nr:aspartate carbamoyltransferase [Christensenellaceae bacterium]
KINIPVFNAGDGRNEHPTQTILDLVTIYDEFKRFDGVSICFIGDIKNSRVAHGNSIVCRTLGMKTYIAGPEEFLDDTAERLTVDEAIEKCDVCMFLRVQNERHNSEDRVFAPGEYLANYGLTKERAARLKERAIVMHPAPFNRGVEIEDCVVESPKSRIFRQITNGVYTRMAVLDMSFANEIK